VTNSTDPTPLVTPFRASHDSCPPSSPGSLPTSFVSIPNEPKKLDHRLPALPPGQLAIFSLYRRPAWPSTSRLTDVGFPSDLGHLEARPLRGAGRPFTRRTNRWCVAALKSLTEPIARPFTVVHVRRRHGPGGSPWHAPVRARRSHLVHRRRVTRPRGSAGGRRL